MLSILVCVDLIHAAHCHVLFFFYNDTPTTEIYTLSLHDALPIFAARGPTFLWWKLPARSCSVMFVSVSDDAGVEASEDRKSTRLNSSHVRISYAVFCLKKKKKEYKKMLLKYNNMFMQYLLNVSHA